MFKNLNRKFGYGVDFKKRTEKAFDAIAELAKTLKIEITTPTEVDGYDSEFIAKIKQGEEDFKAGKYQVIKTSDLWK